MANCGISIMGYYRIMKTMNDDLFKNLTVPTGIDKDTLINNILLEGAEFTVLYSDPYFMQEAIGTWSAKWQRTMELWVKGFAKDFDPIENYDRQEEWTDTNMGTSTGKDSGTNKNTGSAEVENKVSAYDSNTMQDASSSNTSNTNTSTTSNESESSNSNTGTHTGRVHGNIGVTTSTAVLREFIDYYGSNGLYDKVTTLFLSEFCIPVY